MCPGEDPILDTAADILWLVTESFLALSFPPERILLYSISFHRLGFKGWNCECSHGSCIPVLTGHCAIQFFLVIVFKPQAPNPQAGSGVLKKLSRHSTFHAAAS